MLRKALAILLVYVSWISAGAADDLKRMEWNVEGVTRELAKYLRPGQLISLESTTYPGTTEEIMLPILEAVIAPDAVNYVSAGLERTGAS